MIYELSLYNRADDSRLQPRTYSNGITQVQAVNEVLQAFEEGNKIVVLSGGAGSGKTCPRGVVTLMADGSWKDVSEIKKGDKVISPQKDGTTTVETVIETHSRMEKDIYSVGEHRKSFDVVHYKCAGNHDIPLYCRKLHKKNSKVDYSIKEYQYEIFEARELYEKSKTRWFTKGRYAFTSPLIESFGQKNKLFDPYLLGLFIGDGTRSHVMNTTFNICNSNNIIWRHLKRKYSCKRMVKTNKEHFYIRFFDRDLKTDVFKQYQGKTAKDKYIPKEYLFASSDDRFALFAGLIDTDGYISDSSKIEYTTKSEQLAKDIHFFVHSLGGRAIIREKMKNCQSFDEKRKYYTVSIRFNLQERKKFLKYMHNTFKKKRLLTKPNKDVTRFTPVIKKEKPEMVYGFQITGESHFYITNNFCVTHNSIVGLETINQTGNGYIVVPRIFHQDQYRKDYSDENSRLYMKSPNGSIVDIQTLKGKKNFVCRKFVGDQIKKAKDDNSSESEEELQKRIEKEKAFKCDFTGHVCNRKVSSKVKMENCPWYMVNAEIQEEQPPDEHKYQEDEEDENEEIEYQSVGRNRKITYKDSDVCHYHKQFLDSIERNVVIINSKKLEVEVAIKRLPKKSTLVVDEFDIFLKELTAPKPLRYEKIKTAISAYKNSYRGEDTEDEDEVMDEILQILQEEIDEAVTTDSYANRKIVSHYRDQVFMVDSLEFENSVERLKRLFSIFKSKDNDFLEDIKGVEGFYKAIAYNNIPANDLNFYFETDLGGKIGKQGLTLMMFTLDASSVVQNIFAPFDHVLLMSATRQSDEILSRFYGIEHFKEVKTEETIVGKMFNTTLGCEISFKAGKQEAGQRYSDFKREERLKHLIATGEVIERTRKMEGNYAPFHRLFHISAFGRLPEETDLMLHDGLRELGCKTEDDDESAHFEKFRDPNTPVYLHKSTKMFRAIDLPGDLCRVVIFQKLPFPVSTPYHSAIGHKYGESFKWNLLWDECTREIIQGATRGIRNSQDWCFVVSPDIRVNQQLKKIFFRNPRMDNIDYQDGVIRSL